MRDSKFYLRYWLRLVLIGVLGAVLINLIVDPYDLYGLLRSPHFNAVKPRIGAYREAAKAYGIERNAPAGLILGNSRAEVGFDPQHQAWPVAARPVYNAALPGTGVYTSLRYLQHAAAVKPLQLVVIGVDFMDFLVAPQTAMPTAADPAQTFEKRLRVTREGTPNGWRRLQYLQDLQASLFSLDGLLDSVVTLLAAYQAHPNDLTESGFNPMRNYEAIVRVEGYYALFRQRNEDNVKAFLARPQHLFKIGTTSSPPLKHLQEIIALCRREGSELHLIIYPYHAQLLEIIRLTELWPLFEIWKETLVTLLEEEALAQNAAPFPLWDFSGYHALAIEPVPPKDDTRGTVRGYWEAGHFKKALGDILLERLFGQPDPDVPEEFGVRLTGVNLQAHLERQRRDQLHYEDIYPQDVAEIAGLVNVAKTRIAKSK